MSRVGIDLDGVCYDFVGVLESWLRNSMNAEDFNFGPSTRWEFYEDWGMDLQDFIYHCNRGVNAGFIFKLGGVINDAVAQLQRLRDAGHTIVLITDRSFGAEDMSRKNTMAWLAREGLVWDEIHFTANKASVRVDYMIDDKPDNVVAMFTANVDAWLMKTPWNEGLRGRFNTTDSLKGYVDYVLGADMMTSLKGYVDASSTIDARSIDYPGEPVHYEIEEVRKTASTGGQKGTKLARFDLMPAGPLWAYAELLGKGAMKYADRNWELGYPWGDSYAALQRHLNLFWAGEDIDAHKPDCEPDCVTHTESPHLACAMFHCMALLEWSTTHPEFDNRVKS